MSILSLVTWRTALPCQNGRKGRYSRGWKGPRVRKHFEFVAFQFPMRSLKKLTLVTNANISISPAKYSGLAGVQVEINYVQ